MSWLAGKQSAEARKAAEELKKRRDKLTADEAKFLEEYERAQAADAPHAPVGGPSFIQTGAPEHKTQIGSVPAPTVATGSAHQMNPVERIQGAKVAREYVPDAYTIGGRQMGRTQLGPASQMEAARMLAARIDQDQANALRGRQGDAIGMLEAAAQGKAPSNAEALYRRAMVDMANNQFAMAAASRGSGRNALMRQAMQQGGASQQKAAFDFAAMATDEQAKARQQLIGALEGARGQDMNLAMQQAQMEQQSNLTNAQLLQQARQGNMQALNELNVRQGMMDASREQFNAQSMQAADIANQNAINDRSVLRANQAFQANMAEAGYGQDASKFNAGSANDADRFNAQQRQQMGLAEMEAQNRAALAFYQGELQRQALQGEISSREYQAEMERLQRGYMFNAQAQDRYNDRALQEFYKSLEIKDSREAAAFSRLLAYAQLTNGMYGDAYKGTMNAQAARDGAFNSGMQGLTSAAMMYATLGGGGDPNITGWGNGPTPMGAGMRGATGPMMSGGRSTESWQTGPGFSPPSFTR
jgi:hypothetical protein